MVFLPVGPENSKAAQADKGPAEGWPLTPLREDLPFWGVCCSGPPNCLLLSFVLRVWPAGSAAGLGEKEGEAENQGEGPAGSCSVDPGALESYSRGPPGAVLASALGFSRPRSSHWYLPRPKRW
ncbi:hypothetical protein SKAU_G00135540 [Synaphobranchus kaupii]|uniref:Uncharacterized protein n=1 Tax=Synaphobranchus kaupii TaxID=118154 RepID=A0A9Q1FRF7_SYNKA|nr:hypothetical protein SKAU_G00135540 [Synaphobranchus kaupii]